MIPVVSAMKRFNDNKLHKPKLKHKKLSYKVISTFLWTLPYIIFYLCMHNWEDMSIERM